MRRAVSLAQAKQMRFPLSTTHFQLPINGLLRSMSDVTIFCNCCELLKCVIHMQVAEYVAQQKQVLVIHVIPSMNKCHHIVKQLLVALRARCDEFLPLVRMVEICNIHASCGIAGTKETSVSHSMCFPP